MSEILLSIKNRGNPSTTLVIVSESDPDGRLKFFKEIAKEGLEVDCRPPTGRELPAWLIGRFRAKGATLTMDGARAIIERAGEDIGVLEGEAEKLSLFPGPEAGPVGPAEAERWVSLGPTAEIYELGSPLGAGRLDRGLSTLMDLLRADFPMKLIYPIGTHFRRLLALKAVQRARGSDLDDQALAAAIGVKAAMIRFIRPQLASWTLPRLKEAVAALEEAHRAFVTSRLSQDMILQALAVKLGVLAGAGDPRDR
jgi:DNA polymerase-3 subunit delta